MTLPYWLFGITTIALSFHMMLTYFRLNHPLRPNVILVMFVCHVLQQLAPSVVIALDRDAIAGPTYFLACAVTAILIPIGGLIGNTLLPITRQQQERFRRSPVSRDLAARRATSFFFLTLLAFCAALFVAYTQQTERMPLLRLVTGELTGQAIQIVRRMEGKGAFGLIFGIGQRFFMPLLFLTALIGLSYFKARLLKLFSVLSLGIAFLYNAWAMDKTPVATLFLVGLILFLLRTGETLDPTRTTQGTLITASSTIRRRRRLHFLMAALIVLMIGYPVFVFIFMPTAQHGFGYILEKVFLRVFYKPAFNSYTAIEAFTYSVDYTYFRDINKLADLLGLEYFNLSEFISIYKGISAFSNAPPTAIGNFYAQGGWIVVILGVLFAAGLFKSLENAFYHMRTKTAVDLALYVLLLHGAFRFSFANYHTILNTETIFPLIAVLIFWRTCFYRAPDRPGPAITGYQCLAHAGAPRRES